MIKGFLDTCTAEGVFEGWARYQNRRGPARIAILHEGKPVARAVADEYRADLLAAKFGHGHYGFRAKLLTRIEPGRRAFVIAEDSAQALEGPTSEFEIPVPHIKRPRLLITVEAMLDGGTAWTDAEIIANLDALELDDACAQMGIERFIDVAFMWILGRRPQPMEAGQMLNDAASSSSPAQICRSILLGDERAKSTTPLGNPYSNEYPFLPFVRKERGGSRNGAGE